jgi:hypothetical protein
MYGPFYRTYQIRKNLNNRGTQVNAVNNQVKKFPLKTRTSP